MDVAAAVGTASGVALVLAGLGVLAARPRRPGARFFVAFSLAWGAEISLSNIVDVLPPGRADAMLFRVVVALILVEVPYLIHFAVKFARIDRSAGFLWSVAAMAYAVLAGLAFASRPDAFVEAAPGEDAAFTPTAVLAVLLPKFGAMYVALIILAGRYARSGPETEAREVTLVSAAIALYATYTAGYYVILYGYRATGPDPDATTLALFLLFLVATFLVAGLVARVLRADRRRAGARRRTLLAVSTLPFLFGAALGAARVADVAQVDLFGALRIGSVLLIAYGLLKHELFDIDLRVRAGLPRSALVGAIVAAFFLVSESIEAVVDQTAGTVAGLFAAGALGLAFRPLQRRADALVARLLPGVEDTATYWDRRRRELYEAAVLGAAEDLVITHRERQVLDALRAKLELSPDEARSIEKRVLAHAPPAAGG